MAFQPVLNTARANVRFAANGVPAEWRWHFTHLGAYTQAEIDALAAGIDAAVDAYFLPIIRANYSYVETYVRGLTSEFDLEATNDTNAGPGLVATGTPLSQQSSFVGSLRTGLTGRSARGRTYAVGLSESQTLNSRAMGATYVADWIDALADMVTAMQAIDWALAVVQFISDGAPLVNGVARLVTDIVAANNNIDTQRRRVGK